MKLLATKLGAVALLSATVIFAQDTNTPARRGAGSGGQTLAPASPSAIPTTNQAGGEALVRRAPLNLSADQRRKLEEANKTYALTATPLFNRLSAARRELDALVNQEKLDEAGLRAKAKEIGEMEADLAVARAQRFVQLRTFMTPEQAHRYNQASPMGRPFQPALHGAQPVAPAPQASPAAPNAPSAPPK